MQQTWSRLQDEARELAASGKHPEDREAVLPGFLQMQHQPLMADT